MTTSKLFSRPVQFRSTEDAISPSSSSSLQTLGGINIKKGIYVGTNCTIGNNLAVSGTTPASALGNASVALNGGLTVAQGLMVSGSGTAGSPFGVSLLPAANNRQCSIDFHTLASGISGPTNLVWTLGNNVSGITNSMFTLRNNFLPSAVITVTADTAEVSFNGTVDSTAPYNGAVHVAGGLGVEGSSSFGMTANFLSGADFKGQRLTGLGMPIDPHDATSRAYVDSAIQGLDIKNSCRAATTGPIDLSTLVTGSVIDTVTLQTGQRVLVKDQTDPLQNGIWVVTGSTTASVRPPDFDNGDMVSGAFTFIEDGHTNINAGFVCVSPESQDIVGTYPIIWTQFAGAGSISADQPRIRYIGTTDEAISNTSGGLVVSGGLAVTKSIRSGGDIFSNVDHRVATEDWVRSQNYASANQSNLVTFTASNNVSTPRPIPDLVFTNFFNKDLLVQVVTTGGTFTELCNIVGYVTPGASKLDLSSYGDDIGIDFTVDSTGQIYYTIPSIPNWTSTTMYWKISQNATKVVDPESTTDSTSTTSGSTVFKGGVAIQKNLNVGLNIHADGTVTQGSDERYKKDITEIQDALSIVRQIKGVRYTDKRSGERRVGVVAQQISDILPEVVSQDEFGVLSVSYGNMISVLVNAIKELATEVEYLRGLSV